jgi:hypothetical protein
MATMTEQQCKELYDVAYQAGIEAGNAVNEVPITISDVDVVTGAAKPSGNIYVAAGVCGFASVNIKPANSKFAKWLIKNKLAGKSEYYGGVMYYVHNYGQSYERKSAFAYAFANKLYEAGIKKADVYTRLD